MKQLVGFLFALLIASPVFAQTKTTVTATVTQPAPIFIQPGAQTPLRTAAVGTTLKVLQEQKEWVEVEFNDPQFGRRVGWVRASLLKILRPETQPMDLSVREETAPAAGRPQQPRNDAATAPAQYPRGYVMGLGGVTFDTETGGMFGGEGGGWVGRNVIIFGEVGRMLNIAPKELQDNLDEAEDILELTTGLDWGFESKVPGTYFGGGIKYLAPSSIPLNFYVAGSVGGVSLKAEVTEQDFGDIIDDLVEGGYLDEDDVEGTEFYFSVGGGLMGSIGRSAVYDVGYRFMRINEVNVSRVMGGLGIRF